MATQYREVDTDGTAPRKDSSGVELRETVRAHADGNMETFWAQKDAEDAEEAARMAPKKKRLGLPLMGPKKGDKNLKRRNYFDRDGAIRFELIPRLHHAQSELQTVLKLDKAYIHPNETMYVINMRWLCGWINFTVHGNRTPSEINNHKLVNRKSGKVKSAVMYNKHWRPVNKEVWDFLFSHYSGSPVISFKVGPDPIVGKDDIVEYMTDVKLHLSAVVEWPDLCAPVEDLIQDLSKDASKNLEAESAAEQVRQAGAEAELRRAKELKAKIAAEQAEAAKTVLMGAEGAKQMGEARKLEDEANQLAGAAALNVLNKAKGDELMAEAAELGKQHAAASSEMAGAMMQDMMAQKAADDAKKAEEEAQAAVLAGAANLLGQSGAVDQLKKGLSAKAEADSETLNSTMHMFQQQTADSAFSDALNYTGPDREAKMEDAAARKLQAAWRSKVAREAMQAKRAEQKFLMEDGAARMMQSAWRRLNARRDVARKRAEREMLMQRAAALKFQGAWRRKKARAKMNKLRAERQAKLEEGAAWKLQACWRIRQARKKSNELRAEAQRLRENGAALMVQAAFRKKQARDKVKRMRAERQALLENGAAVLLQSVFRAKKAKNLVQQVRTDLARDNQMSTKVTSLLRQHMAKKHTKAAYRKWTRPFKIRLVNCNGLLKADFFGSSDPYVIVSAMQPDPDHPQAPPQQVASWKSKVVSNSQDPVFDQELTYSGCNGFSTLVFTVLDKDMISLSGASDLLGQCTIDISKESLWVDEPEFTIRQPLGPADVPVLKADGTPVKIDGDEGKGEIVVEFMPRNTRAAAAGWCERFCKHDESSLFGTFKKQWSARWLVITEEGLWSHETPKNLNNVDKHVPAEKLGATKIVLNYEEKDTVLQVDRLGSDPLYFYFAKPGEALMFKAKLEVVVKRTGRSAKDLAAAAEAGAAEMPTTKRSSGSKRKGLGGMFGK